MFEVPFENLFPGEERYLEKELTLPDDTFLVSFTPHLEGNPSLLHHADVVYKGEKNFYCPEEPLTLYSTGTELSILKTFGLDYGIFTRKGEEVKLLVHLANANKKTESGKFVLKAVGKAQKKQATPVPLSIADYCSKEFTTIPTEYSIPGGISHHEARMARPFIVPKDGNLLGWGGHLHTYGTSLALLKNERTVSILKPAVNPRKDVDTKESVYLPGYFFSPPIRVKEGDILNLLAVYDKPQDLFFPGAMGIGFLSFDFN